MMLLKMSRSCVVFLLAACCAAGTVSAAPTAALATDRLALADRLFQKGMYSEAADEYEALLAAKELSRDDVLFRLGESRRLLKQDAKALAAYSSLLSECPGSKLAYRTRLQKALLSPVDARIAELRKLGAEGTPADVRAAALYHLGLALEKPGNNAEALAAYDQLAKVAPQDRYAAYGRLRSAALMSASPDAAVRRQALGTYLELADAKDVALAEEALYFAARQSLADGRNDESATLFRRLAQKYPSGARAADAEVPAAWANYSSGRFNEALALAQAAAERTGRDDREEALYLRAAALAGLERRAEAVTAYTAELKEFPAGRYADAAWFERLRTRAADGDHAGVLAELAARPDPPAGTADRAWWIAGESALAVSNNALAAQYLRLSAKAPGSVYAKDATYRLGWLLARTGDLAGAAGTYRTVAEKWPADPLAARALYAAGEAEARAGKGDDALRDWTDLLAKYPDSSFAPDALYRKAMEEIRRRDYKQADRTLGELLRRFPRTERLAEVLYFHGFTASALGDDPEAEKRFRASLAAKPAPEFEREDLLALGGILKKTGRDAEAAKLFARILGTAAVDRLAADRLAWVADTMLAAKDFDAALAAAGALAKRNVDAGWNQAAATVEGEAREAKGETDAALAAYRRALATDARTTYGAQAALAAGRLESAAGHYDAAKKDLSDAVERAGSNALLAVRARAYAALAANEEARGDKGAALGYHMLVGTLFDDAELVPPALARAAAILAEQGKAKDAAELRAELVKRYPDSAAAKGLK